MPKLLIMGAAYGTADVTDKVRRMVAGDALSLTPSNRAFADGLPGAPEPFVLVYRYADQAPRTAVVVEHETLTIAHDGKTERYTAPRVGELAVYGAVYGRGDVRSTVAQRVSANGVRVNADNATFGDTWPNTLKSFTLVYGYGPTDVKTLVVTENAPVLITPPLTILGASYGKTDVTTKVAAAVKYDTLNVAVGNATFGDSWPGVQKALTVVCTYDPAQAPRVVIAVEHTSMVISQNGK